MVKKHYKVVWQDEAKSSLRSIYTRIKEQESLEQAKRVRSRLKEEGDSLGFIPHKYIKELILESLGRDIRFKVVWSYKLVYEVTEEIVVFLDITIPVEILRYLSQSDKTLRLFAACK